MKQQKAQIILLQPTEEQLQYFSRAAGLARFAFNWGLEWWNAQYALHKEGGAPRPNREAVNSAWSAHKKANLPWAYDVSSDVPKWVIYESLPRAFANWWNRKTRQGPPKFKSKRTARRVFVGKDKCKPSDFRHRGVKLAKLGWVRCRSRLRWPASQAKRVTVFEQAGKWYASVAFENPDFTQPAHENQGSVVGVDLGSRKLAVAYDGTELRRWENPEALAGVYRRLRRWQRRAARRGIRDSAGRVRESTAGLREANRHVARLHKRAADIRLWHHHHVSNRLTADYETVGTEDLHVKGMMRSAKGTVEKPGKNVRAKAGLNRKLADAGMGEILRQVGYKSAWRGGRHETVGRFFPSSRVCSDCGQRNDDLQARERWVCTGCGILHDRDENAAKNIYRETVGRSNPEPAAPALPTPVETIASASPAKAGGVSVVALKEAGTETARGVNLAAR